MDNHKPKNLSQTRSTVRTLSSEGTKDHTSVYTPEFANIKVFVLGGAMYGSVVRMMAWAGCEKATSVDEADVVVFVGGADVDPMYYNENPIAETKHTDRERDAFETEVFVECVEKEKIMFGICRGAQFLHVMNGGKLWQHVENHAGQSHYIYDIEEDTRVIASSLHHQMMRDNDDMRLIAVAEKPVSQIFKSENHASIKEMEVEACAYPETRCFLVQGHPEVGSEEYRSWTLNKLFEFIVEMEETDFFSNTEEAKEGAVG